MQSHVFLSQTHPEDRLVAVHKQMIYYPYPAPTLVVETLASKVWTKRLGGWHNRIYRRCSPLDRPPRKTG